MSSLPIIPVILSGGMGSRLWPMSRSKYPKQFISIGDSEQSLIQQTVSRVVSATNVKKPVIVSNVDHRFLVAEHMLAIGLGDTDILLEPAMRNTAPAITAAALHIQKHSPDALMLVLPSDHIIEDVDAFHAAIDVAAKAAATGKLLTFGIDPEYPETGYGYILRGSGIAGHDGAYELEGFVEKPDEKTAQGYIDNGNYSWNSGMFMFPVSTFLDEIESNQPTILQHCTAAINNAQEDTDFVRLDEEYFVKNPNISVDYAVMEQTKKAAVVPVSCGWNDAGAWDSLWRMGDKTEDGNVAIGDVYAHNSKNCYLQARPEQAIAVTGVEDIVVVATDDTVLVTHKDKAQDVKKLMEQVREVNPELVEHHNRVYRPWGFYESIMMGPRHQVKHIQVQPGAKLSVQMHHHRAEHWTIVNGTAKMYLGDEEHIMTENDYIFIPLGEVHSIENVGTIPLNFIEVQHGSYLGEDDIVRFEDMYGRTGTNT